MTDDRPTRDDVFRAVVDAYRDGELDRYNAGVPTPAVADRLDRHPKTKSIDEALRELVDDGHLVERWGKNPDNGAFRKSYLPRFATDEGGDGASTSP